MAGTGAGGDQSRRLIEAASRCLAALERPGPLLIAYSGGGDSTALLHALSDILKTGAFPGITLHAATVDHALRPGAGAEAERAGAFARSLGIPHSILRWNHDGQVAALQAAARQARYRLLAEEAKRLGAIAILTGHNADDQSETIAMRRARGEGEGLSGMAPAVLVEGSAWVLRPLLGLGREEIRAALRAKQIGWIDDPSNENPRFERIRLRARADLPVAMAAFDRMQAVRAQADWLSRSASIAAGAVATVCAERLDDLGDLNLQSALFKLAAAIGGKVHLPERTARERVMAFLRSGMPGRITLGGTVFDRRAAELHLYREARGLPHLHLAPGETARWDGRWHIHNGGTRPVEIMPAGADGAASARLEAAGVPPAIARRAAPAMPCVQPEEGAESIGLTRQIAAHAHFLPSFELPLAECFASLFGLRALPPLPVTPDFLAVGPDSAPA